MVNYQIRDTTTSSEQDFFNKIYWISKLSGELPETNFITDYVRPRIYSFQTNSISFKFPIYLSTYIIKLANGSELSIYLILVTALNILLQKYTGNNDIILGLPIYKKHDNAKLENQVVALRSQVISQLTGKDLLLQVKDTVIGAYSHQNYSFDELIKLLNLSETQNRCPIFDIVILLKNIHTSDCIANIKNDVTIAFDVIGNTINGEIEYNKLLFKEENIKLINKYYIGLIKSFVQNLETPISELTFLAEEDNAQILKGFNNNTYNFPVDRTLHELFEEQAFRTPNQIAAVDDKTELTYQQLNERANQLARLLQNLGVKSGKLIAIAKQRDINFLIAILAILKAGGAYIPIDISYPSERIHYMLSNSEVRMVLTDSSCVNLLAGSWETCQQLKHVIFLDEKPNISELKIPTNVNICTPIELVILPVANLERNTQGIAPAYMIYTSGSTGLPKGAIIRHGGAINHIYAQFAALELNANLTFLQTAPASSDISVWQFLAPILIGGKTVIVNTETVCHPEKLFQVLKQRKITIVELVPVVLAGLLDYISQLAADERLLPHLQWMMVTGESASVELVNRWLKIYPKIKVVNAYGPTEAADDITQFIIDKSLPENQRTVPIGKPLANLNLYILDPQMQLLPIGALGEICVSGFGVGQGYWKNQASTQRSFVPNPFKDTAKPLPGTDTDIIYKTGDLGRWLPDGNIEFFGRIDHQVKIRGFRIELGEIEALLSQHPAVGENVVVVREDTPADKRLVAYIVPKISDSSLEIPQLRQFLKERLPEYMVPSAFMLMESLPLTPSGKVDHKALPVPDISQSKLEVSFVLPRTSTEQIVADIWADVLRREQVGINDNFFDLGGHSLLATQIISRLREAFKVDLPLRSLFENPTVKNLVEQIEVILTVQQLQAVPLQMPEDREEIEL
ncbi:amino acid adenylation domain-containing protein [Nostoc sphaeroides CHAB 2801]|uniref:non-ribosomal peptide synthetase n=1 Tax=Nostoc sphaeroides TaxID=446679 RepID=UPI001E3FBB8E|nr:non-ribosomal peptide synthetase [Nostoc sphaeroides]MCC5632725.1 amino acid adenylation domain-containing protein [Nostoc sphaeroides CHAB 2801]